jgi:hypothetical protein
VRHVSIQQLSAFVDGALTGVSRELVTRHLAACPDCRERHAMWHIYDEVLKRVLSWEPNERTLEEASARIELILTAERRGMPVPEFTSVLPPVIASGPDSGTFARDSGLFSGASGSFAAGPGPNPSSRMGPPGTPPAMSEPFAPSALPVEPMEPGYARVPRRRKRTGNPVFAVCAVLVLLALVSLPFLPEVIRIPVPGAWQPRVPRVEFMPHEQAAAPTPVPSKPPLQLAEHAAVEPVLVPQHLSPAPVESVATKPAEPAASRPSAPATDTVALRSSAPAKLEAAKPRPAATSVHAERPAPAKKPAPVPRPSPPPAEEHVTYGEDHPVTIVPVQVKTEVNLAPTAPAKPAPQAAASDSGSDDALPLLCGEVVDESGAPVEGARVTIAALSLSVRTDKRGHFCVACAPGERSLVVEMPGYAPATRAVTLTGPMVETRITLAVAP